MKRKQNHFLIMLFVFMLTMCILSGCSDYNGKKMRKDYSNIVENPNISIPGYESLEFKAGKKKQSVNFYNPEENTCYFRISLVLDKGDKEDVGEEKETDEEILWTSELIEPEEEVKNITLEKELESGDYPAKLKYECFSLKDKRQLNGSNIAIMLSVR